MIKALLSPAGLAAVAWFVWALSVALIVWPFDAANAMLRVVVAALLAVITLVAVGRRAGLLLLSPAYVLGALIIVFYSIVPALYVMASPEPPAFAQAEGTGGHFAATGLVGSLAELVLIQFAALCLAIAASTACREIAAGGAHGAPALDGIGLAPLCAIVLVLGAAYVLIGGHGPLTAFASAGIGAQFKHALAPAMAFCLALLAYRAGAAPARQAVLAAGVMFAALALMASSGLAETPAFMTAAALLLLVMRRGLSGPALFRVVAGIAAVLTLAVALGVVSRNMTTAATPSTLQLIEGRLVAKLVHRQAFSANCLNRIVNIFNDEEKRSPFYFLHAVVPRVLWPDKPVLSRGHEYAVKYCGMGPNVDPRHSESVTLIGEPVLAAGWAGLAAAEAFVVIVFAAFALIGLGGGPVRLIVMTAMLPWLANSGQHFAQYFGNMVKMFLIMLPLALLLAWIARRAASRTGEAEKRG